MQINILLLLAFVSELSILDFHRVWTDLELFLQVVLIVDDPVDDVEHSARHLDVLRNSCGSV